MKSYSSVNTMGEAIALGAPTAGRMSKRSREAALKRLSTALFPDGFPQPELPKVNRREQLLRRAKELRDLAGRGMHQRLYKQEAERLEEEAEGLLKAPFIAAALAYSGGKPWIIGIFDSFEEAREAAAKVHSKDEWCAYIEDSSGASVSLSDLIV